MPRKIAILGSSTVTMDQCPFDDPEWEVWGLTWRYRDHPRMDRCFEIHAERFWDEYAGDLYRAWLKDPHSFGEDRKPIDVYLRPEDVPNYPKCKPYPVEQAQALMGRNYFVSSFSYMFAAAILEQPDEIGLWGIDLVVGEEYEYQRPNAEFLLGIAQAKGIELTIPQHSSLLKYHFTYGLETPPEERPLYKRTAETREEYQRRINEAKEMIWTWQGAVHQCDEQLKALEAISRGSLGGEV